MDIRCRPILIAWLLIPLVSACPLLITSEACAQDLEQVDRIKLAGETPPQFLPKNNSQWNVAAIDWRLKILASLDAVYSASKAETSVKLAQIEEFIALKQKELAIEVRFTDAATRSQLAGRVVDVILETKLELASKEKMLEVLMGQEVKAKNPNPMKEHLQADLDIAKAELENAKEQFEYANAQYQRGVSTMVEVKELRTKAEIAAFRVKKAEMSIEAAANESDRETVNRIAELRLSILPLKAKLRAAEEFLAKFSDSAVLINNIEQSERESGLLRGELQLVVAELSKISREVTQLTTLKGQIEAAVKAAEEPVESEAPQK